MAKYYKQVTTVLLAETSTAAKIYASETQTKIESSDITEVMEYGPVTLADSASWVDIPLAGLSQVRGLFLRCSAPIQVRLNGDGSTGFPVGRTVGEVGTLGIDATALTQLEVKHNPGDGSTCEIYIVGPGA